jgi:hypothetical protein
MSMGSAPGKSRQSGAHRSDRATTGQFEAVVWRRFVAVSGSGGRR